MTLEQMKEIYEQQCDWGVSYRMQVCFKYHAVYPWIRQRLAEIKAQADALVQRAYFRDTFNRM